MKKNLKIFLSIFLVSGFLVACGDGGDQEEPATPDAPSEQAPEDGTGTEPGTETETETDEGM